jgi:hypothetical protein
VLERGKQVGLEEIKPEKRKDHKNESTHDRNGHGAVISGRMIIVHRNYSFKLQFR